MRRFNSAALLLVGSSALVGLTGCEQAQQAANDVVVRAKQAAVQALYEAHQSASIEQAKESANQALLEAKQQAARLLGQPGEYLSSNPPGQDVECQTEPGSTYGPVIMARI